MYWYKTKLAHPANIIICSLLAVAVSCSKPHETATDANTSNYYPVQAFFKKEVDSLRQHNPTVQKTVGKDAEEETKTVHIKNWGAELGAFLAIDLTKATYAGMYEVDSTERQILYTAKSDDVDIQSLSILFDESHQVTTITAMKNEDNFLYQNREQLSYLRGKGYTLFKEQHILLLGTTQYQIVGKFDTN